MTEKGKAIEDGTIELPTGPAEKKKPHRGRIVVITVAALALLAAGGVAWRAHEDRLMAEARADCAAESERLRVATTAYDALLDGKAASMAKTDVKSVKDAKALDVLSKAMKASTPKTVSCKADSRPQPRPLPTANSTRPSTTRTRCTRRRTAGWRTTRPAQVCWTPSRNATRTPSRRP